MKETKIRVAVVGAGGYAGGELLRLLAAHPHVAVTTAVSESNAGKALASAFPGSAIGELKFARFDRAALIEQSDLIFLAQESGRAMQQVPAFLDAGKKVIDLSADFRLKDPGLYPEWYGLQHCSKEMLAQAVYGLPEMYRKQIGQCSLAANPGCYPTACILALLPLLESDLIEPSSILIDAKSGISGAGRSKHSLEYHFPEINESVRAYAAGGAHRHIPEIEQELSGIKNRSIRITFTPHLIPVTRGILATCYAALRSGTEGGEIQSLYKRRYRDEPFVRICDEGRTPTTKGCCGTNQCHIGLAHDTRTGRIIVVSAIDNLVKGAAGQAIQNMNLMLGLDETTGLLLGGIWP